MGAQVCWHAAGPRESTGCPPATAGDGRRTGPGSPAPSPGLHVLDFRPGAGERGLATWFGLCAEGAAGVVTAIGQARL